MPPEQLTLRYIPLNQALRWERNPKRHGLPEIIESIAHHGFKDPPKFEPLLNDGQGGIVEGNGRIEALTQMHADGQQAPRGIIADDNGMWTVPILFGVDAPSMAAAESYGVSHNNLTLAGAGFTPDQIAMLWEPDTYAALLASLQQAGETPIGLTDAQLAKLLTALAPEPEPGNGGDEFDVDTALEQPSRVQLGDIWQIGDVHRLACGDSRDKTVIDRLLAGERPVLMVTDPPYGVKYDPKWRHERNISHGTGMLGEVLNDDVTDWSEAYQNVDAQVAYVWHAGLYAAEFAWSLDKSGYKRIAQIIWVKDQFALGRGDYHYQHEPCWYAVREKETHNWQGSRTQTSTWQIRRLSSNVETSDEEVWGHSTQKPLECMARPMRNNTEKGDLVCDPFLGSGTSMIAAHREGRRCYGVELSTTYCEVILQRAEAEGLRVELVWRGSAAGAADDDGETR